MSEDSAGGVQFRQATRKRSDNATIADFTQIVMVPDQPRAIRVFTAAEDAEARQYAIDAGGIVVPLPLPRPRGYIGGPDGHLIPETGSVGLADLSSPDRRGRH